MWPHEQRINNGNSTMLAIKHISNPSEQLFHQMAEIEFWARDHEFKSNINTFSLNTYTKKYKKLLENDFILYTAKFNDNTIGFIMGCFNSQISQIDHLYVLPNYQNMGIGSKLFSEFKKHSAKIGVSEIILLRSAKSYHFYTKNGCSGTSNNSDRIMRLEIKNNQTDKSIDIITQMKQRIAELSQKNGK